MPWQRPDPFPHTVIDGWCNESLLLAAAAEWPRPDWPHWHRYDDGHAVKYGTKDAARIPDACREVLRLMLTLPVREMTGLGGLFGDWNLHGAGLHMIPAGGRLGLHRDAARHPLLGWRRRLSVMLYANAAWDSAWGGALELWSGTDKPGRCERRIEPAFNRLVLFECNDFAWHGVPQPVACPDHTARLALSAFYWSREPVDAGRDRAEFTP